MNGDTPDQANTVSESGGEELSPSTLDSYSRSSRRPAQLAGDPEYQPEYLIVGQVVAPFGLMGEMKVNIMTEFPQRFASMDELMLAPYSYMQPGLAPTGSVDPKAAVFPSSVAPRLRTRPTQQGFRPPAVPTPFHVERTRIHKGQLLLKLAGVADPETVDLLRGYWVIVPIAQAKKLPKGSYYLYQIVGLDVYTTEREHLGKIVDVLTLTANDVYVVRGPGVKDPTGELLVPAIRSVVKRMEMKRGRIVIAPLSEWT